MYINVEEDEEKGFHPEIIKKDIYKLEREGSAHFGCCTLSSPLRHKPRSGWVR